MAQTAFSIRMDEGLKRDFSQFCENIGMTMSTAFVVFAKAALRSRRIPFEIYDYPVSASPMKKRVTSEEALKAFESIRAEVQSRGVPEMTVHTGREAQIPLRHGCTGRCSLRGRGRRPRRPGLRAAMVFDSPR